MNSGSSEHRESPAQADFERLNALLDEAPGDEASEEEVQAFFDKVLTQKGGAEILQRLAKTVQQGASLDPVVEERHRLAAVYEQPVSNYRLVAKVDLLGVFPSIWRRLSFPSTASFFDIHCAIQDAFDWEDRYPHRFEMRLGDGRVDATFGIAPGEASSEHDYCGVANRAIDLFTENFDVIHYCYQSPDRWELLVQFEKLYEPEAHSGENLPAPVLIAGEGFAPPEDVGGVDGFAAFLEGKHPLSASSDAEILQQWPLAPIDPNGVTFRNPLAVLQE